MVFVVMGMRFFDHLLSNKFFAFVRAFWRTLGVFSYFEECKNEYSQKHVPFLLHVGKCYTETHTTEDYGLKIET